MGPRQHTRKTNEPPPHGHAGNQSDSAKQVGSANLEVWGSPRYPDFVAEGTGDQKAIMGAICAVKKASFDGVDCVGVDDTATGTVSIRPLFAA